MARSAARDGRTELGEQAQVSPRFQIFHVEIGLGHVPLGILRQGPPAPDIGDVVTEPVHEGARLRVRTPDSRSPDGSQCSLPTRESCTAPESAPEALVLLICRNQLKPLVAGMGRPSPASASPEHWRRVEIRTSGVPAGEVGVTHDLLAHPTLDSECISRHGGCVKSVSLKDSSVAD